MYNTSEKMKNNYLTSKAIRKLIGTLLKQLTTGIEECLPAWLLKRAGLIPLGKRFRNIHYPDNPEIFRKAEFRLKFEEFFFIQLNILRNRSCGTKIPGICVHHCGDNLTAFMRTTCPSNSQGPRRRY